MPSFDDEKKSLDNKGILIFIILFILTVIIVAWFVFKNMTTPELDSNTACPVKGP